jgi:uncharacterized protein (DUF1697 family)
MATKKTGRGAGVHVALLRGINLGGRQIPMKKLAEMFGEAGCSDVKTYIQSGNVIFKAADAGRAIARIGKALSDQFRFEVPIVTRTAAELRDVAESNPYLRAGKVAAKLYVVFLANQPEKARVAALDPERSPPDEFTVRGREIYLHCPNGLGRTKLSNQYFDAKLATTSTVRNWRTVLTLLDMAEKD